jgi:flagellar hook-basal body complex protein FliE
MSSAISAISTMASGTGALAGLGSLPAASNPASPTSDATPFSAVMKDAIGEVNQLQDQADTAVRGLMSGSGVDVHQATIATQKASMAFELALSVRNKAVQAYQSVMGMQF